MTLTDTNKNPDSLSLVGEKGFPSFVTPIPKPTRTKIKRNSKNWGYIRRKRVKKRNYYYYTWTEISPAGYETERSIYLGTAEHILEKVKGKKGASF